MIYCIVPAAGRSTRFPWNKLLYIYRDKPLIVQTITNILESGFVKRVVLVTGYQHQLIESIVRKFNLEVDIAYNPDHEAGMSSSIKVGVKYIVNHANNPAGIMVNPGDAAWIHPGVYALLTVRYFENVDNYDIVVASYEGRRGHPIIFSSRLINDLLSISEEKHGLKEVITRCQSRVLAVETNYPGVLLDLDTVVDLLRVKSTIYI
ncbi:MAG: nucleotidyltransferase family protein [Desulfurococcaceae archaeon]